jgi:glycosyltransferase involved in cell wall biosynthesis
MPMPLVSVVMPVRNGAAHLAEAVDSILAQSLAALELIVVDDGSTDRTPAILQEAAARDPRLRVESRPAGGIVAALNEGLALARSPLIARMDADDVAEPNRLVRQVEALEANPSVALLGSAYRVIDRDGRPLRTVDLPTSAEEVRAALPRSNCIAHPTVLMRREAVLAAGGYRAAFPYCEDYDLWLRLSERADLINLPDRLLRYREHAGQSTIRDLEARVSGEVRAVGAALRRRRGLAEAPETPALPADLARRAFDVAAGALGEGKPSIAAQALTIALRSGAWPRQTWPRYLRLKAKGTLLALAGHVRPSAPPRT